VETPKCHQNRYLFVSGLRVFAPSEFRLLLPILHSLLITRTFDVCDTTWLPDSGSEIFVWTAPRLSSLWHFFAYCFPRFLLSSLRSRRLACVLFAVRYLLCSQTLYSV
jgi:hypothetical protein